MSTVSQTRPAGPRQAVPLPVAVALLIALLLGFGIGRLTDRDHNTDNAGKVRVGTVGVVDSDGTVCMDDGNCYLAPGAGLTVGTKIHYRVEKVLLDPDDPAAGKQSVLVYVTTD